MRFGLRESEIPLFRQFDLSKQVPAGCLKLPGVEVNADGENSEKVKLTWS
jgi:hypothetical protein